MLLAAPLTSAPPSDAPAGGGPAWSLPGALVLRLIGVALVLLVLGGAASAWLVARAVPQQGQARLLVFTRGPHSFSHQSGARERRARSAQAESENQE